jgi:crotonobetainyl-CoA:carnitine CoA-transferase CaiB-like acyl-CoA transferase
MSGKMLEGIKVVDFSWVYAGPLMTRTLVNYGATVIKIEGRTRHDIERTHGPYRDNIPGLDRAGTYLELNTGKLSLAINLTKPKAKEIAKRLITWADVVVENYSGGTMDKMGLGYEVLRKINPSIIMLSASMQGQTGPHAHHLGFGMQLTALSGYDYIGGWPDREPDNFAVYTDWIAAHYGTAAIMAALDYRARTGKGQYLDLSEYETAVQYISPSLLDYDVNEAIAYRQGNRCEYAAPHGAYRCLGDDRWCAISIFTDEEWKNFCNVIGNPPWTKDTRFSDLAGRKENEDELDKLVEEWTVNKKAEDVMTYMQSAGVAAGLVQTIEDLMENDPQLKHNKFYWDVDNAEIGLYRVPRPPFVTSKSTYEMKSSPLLGEHNEYVCKEILKMTDDEMAELVIEGVIE